jgi:hypothetical protein
MLKKHLSCDRCFLDAKTTFLAKYVKKCINFALFHENFRKNSNFFSKFQKINFFSNFQKIKNFKKSKNFQKKIQKIDSER